MRRGRILVRAGAILALVIAMAVVMASVGGAASEGRLSKKEKKQGDKRWLNTGEAAANAQLLDGMDSTTFQRRVHWARVEANGSISAQSGEISVSEDGNGFAAVRFPVSTHGGAILAEPLWDSGFLITQTRSAPCGGPPLGIDCGLAEETVNDAYVETFDGDGDITDGAFFVALIL